MKQTRVLSQPSKYEFLHIGIDFVQTGERLTKPEI